MQIIARSERIYLREIELSDWRAVHSYGSDPRVVEFQAWGPHSEQDSRDWVQFSIAEQTKTPRKMYYWAVCLNDSDAMIGGLGVDFAEAIENAGTAEIGYSLHPSHWHRGLGREAVRLMISTLFSTTSLHRLIAHCRDVNLSSIRLLEAVGFQREGHFMQDTWVREKLMNSYWYALLKEAR